MKRYLIFAIAFAAGLMATLALPDIASADRGSRSRRFDNDNDIDIDIDIDIDDDDHGFRSRRSNRSRFSRSNRFSISDRFGSRRSSRRFSRSNRHVDRSFGVGHRFDNDDDIDIDIDIDIDDDNDFHGRQFRRNFSHGHQSSHVEQFLIVPEVIELVPRVIRPGRVIRQQFDCYSGQCDIF